MRHRLSLILTLLISGCTMGPFTLYGGISYAPTYEAQHDSWPTPTIEYAPTLSPCIVTAVADVNIRSFPWGFRIGKLLQGETAIATGKRYDSGDWWYQTAEGYIHGDWLELSHGCDMVPIL